MTLHQEYGREYGMSIRLVKRWASIICLSVFALPALALVSGLRAQDLATQEPAAIPALVHLRDVDPSILQDIRYAGTDNFTGRPLPGYAAAECLLLRDVAEALSRVQKSCSNAD
jgi:D-alanyl-D-alanine dipeptidase